MTTPSSSSNSGKQRKWNMNKKSGTKNNQRGGVTNSDLSPNFAGILGNGQHFFFPHTASPAPLLQPTAGNQQLQLPPQPLPQQTPAENSQGLPTQQQPQQPLPAAFFPAQPAGFGPAPADLFPTTYGQQPGYHMTSFGFQQQPTGHIQQQIQQQQSATN